MWQLASTCYRHIISTFDVVTSGYKYSVQVSDLVKLARTEISEWQHITPATSIIAFEIPIQQIIIQT